MMKEDGIVLITGISGYIGSALGKELSQSYQVVGLDQEIPKEKLPGVHYFSLDITSEESLHETLEKIKKRFGPKIISVVHLVAYYNFDGKESELYESITVKGTQNFLGHLRAKFLTEQFIFSSSMLVYRPVKKGEKIREESPLEPGWAYPASKVKTETMLQEGPDDVPVVNLRIAGVYDDHAHQPTLANQIMRIYEMWLTSVPFPGDPETGQSILHLDDLVDLIPKVIEKRNEFSTFETFAIGEENVLSYKEIHEIVGHHIHKRPWPVVRIPALIATFGAKVMEKLPLIREPFIKPWMIPHADEHFDVDIAKARRVLGWAPKHHLKRKLPEILSNLKANPEKWYAINKIEKPFYRNLREVGSEGERNQWFAAIGIIFLGLWSMANPFGFGDVERWEMLSEVILGFLMIVIAALSLIPTLRWMRWANTGVGSLLMFSPLLIYTRSDAAYLSDTLIGGLVILLASYTPPFESEKYDEGIPPGWTYNPSTAGQRLPIMFLAFLGFLMSRNLASFQLEHIADIWDPFFGDGTRKVLTSDISKAFPVSDAGLGALTYLLDVIAACIGGRSRWRTMPWAVILFGFMIIPTGVTSITLVMLQPIGVGAWCSLCLMTAFLMLIMVPPAVDEVLASVQFLKRKKESGESFWKVFWFGGEAETIKAPPRLPAEGNVIHILLTSVIGMWLMVVPSALGIEGIASANIYIVSALITTFSIIAVSEVARISRLMNVPLGLWLAASAFLIGEMPEIARWHSLIVGLLIAALSLPFGKRAHTFGTSDRWIHWSPL